MLARLIIYIMSQLALALYEPVSEPVVTYSTYTYPSCATAVVEDIEVENNDLEFIVEEMYYDELEYLAACVEAEAGNQGLLGKRYVVDVILNRVDSDKFPNTITEVIEEPKQFSVVSDGRINTVVPSEETYQAIQMELENRLDDTILFFRTGRYHTGYTPCFQHKDHYFSK